VPINQLMADVSVVCKAGHQKTLSHENLPFSSAEKAKTVVMVRSARFEQTAPSLAEVPQKMCK
jgi:hypothetical protein